MPECAKAGCQYKTPSADVYLETLDNAKEHREDVNKAGIKQMVSARNILRKGICHRVRGRRNIACLLLDCVLWMPKRRCANCRFFVDKNHHLSDFLPENSVLFWR